MVIRLSANEGTCIKVGVEVCGATTASMDTSPSDVLGVDFLPEDEELVVSLEVRLVMNLKVDGVQPRDFILLWREGR